MCTFRMSTRESGPMPLYTTPIFGVNSEIFCTVLSSTRIDGTCSGVGGPGLHTAADDTMSRSYRR